MLTLCHATTIEHLIFHLVLFRPFCDAIKQYMVQNEKNAECSQFFWRPLCICENWKVKYRHLGRAGVLIF